MRWHTIGLHVICIAEVPNHGPHFRLGINQVLNGDCGVWGQSSVCHNTQDEWVAGVADCWWSCKVELLTHAQCGISTLVEVLSGGAEVLQGDVVVQRGGEVEDGVSIAEVVHLAVCGEEVRCGVGGVVA